MSNTLLKNIVLGSKTSNIFMLRCLSHFQTAPSAAVKVKEVQIPTDWGHIAAKLWGKEDQRPILALHGWQDNAATWDALIPQLPESCSILAIDFPGHGNSSWIPKGMQYHNWDLPNTIQYIKDYFKWDKISFMAHSMGSIAAMRYASIYPDAVDFYIGIENLVGEYIPPEVILKRLPHKISKLQIEQRRLDTEPPSYSYEQVIKLLHEGTQKSVSLEAAHYLVQRGTKPSKNNPNKFYFCRDSRLKHIIFIPEDREIVKLFISNMKTPSLYVKAIDSEFANDEFSIEIREQLLKTNAKFECHFVKGTHHVHLNNPERVAPLIIDFLNKQGVIRH